MEEEKQHEAAEQQPGTEVLAEERPEHASQVEDAASPEPVSETQDGEPTPRSETDEAPSSSDSEDETALEVAEQAADSQEPADEGEPDSEAEVEEHAESEVESGDDASLPDGGGSDAEDEASPDTSISAFELIGSTEDQATEAETDAATLKAVLEAIVYVLPEPVPAAQMAAALNQPVERVEGILRELMDDTSKPERGVFIPRGGRRLSGGHQAGAPRGDPQLRQEPEAAAEALRRGARNFGRNCL